MPRKPAKKAAAKKAAAAKPKCPSYISMAVDAIKTTNDRTGVSAIAIEKFITAKYKSGYHRVSHMYVCYMRCHWRAVHPKVMYAALYIQRRSALALKTAGAACAAPAATAELRRAAR